MPLPKAFRWWLAILLVASAAVLIMISNMTDDLRSCSVVNRNADMPVPIIGQGEQSAIPLPIRVCKPIDFWIALPIGVLALFLVLPDFREIGLGPFAIKQFEQISKKAELISKEAESIRETLSQATGIRKNAETGELWKGEIRNVELRIATVQDLLLNVLQSHDDDPGRSIYQAGLKWGESWSRDFAKIEGQADVSTAEGIRTTLQDWSYYDATAGMGRIYFEYEADGMPRGATVVSGFLSIERDGIDLRHLVGGYIAGSLNGFFSSRHAQFRVSLDQKAAGIDKYQIEPRHGR